MRWLSAALSLFAAVAAFDFVGTVSPAPREPDARVLLDGGLHSSPVFVDGAFAIRDVPVPGVYVLSVLSRGFVYPTYLVQLAEASEEDIEPLVTPFVWGTKPNLTHVPEFSIPYPLVVEGTKIDYDKTVRSFDLWQTLKSNPLIPLMAIGTLMALGVPRLLELVDPETMREVQEQQASMHSSLQSMKAVGTGEGLAKYLSTPSKSKPPPSIGSRKSK